MYTKHQSWPELFLAVRRVSSSTSHKVFVRIATAALWSTASGLTKGSLDWTFGRVRGPELGHLDVNTAEDKNCRSLEIRQGGRRGGRVPSHAKHEMTSLNCRGLSGGLRWICLLCRRRRAWHSCLTVGSSGRRRWHFRASTIVRRVTVSWLRMRRSLVPGGGETRPHGVPW